MDHLGSMADDDQLLHCEASGVYQQLGQRMKQLCKDLPSQTVLAQKLNTMWEPRHEAGHNSHQSAPYSRDFRASAEMELRYSTRRH